MGAPKKIRITTQFSASASSAQDQVSKIQITLTIRNPITASATNKRSTRSIAHPFSPCLHVSGSQEGKEYS
jgi:hypothetical protein